MTDNIYNKRGKKHYVSQNELFVEFNNSITEGKCTDKLLMYARRITKRFSTTLEYTNKCDLDACIEYALGEFYQKWSTFDPARTNNIFSYYTTMLANDMKLHYKQLNKGKELQISIDALFSGNKD